MYYYVKNNDQIEKYKIEFDKEKLKRLRIEIINNCSEITHKEYNDTIEPNYLDYLKIRNYKRQKLGTVEGKGYSPDKTLYHLSYDEYTYPYLVTLIDKLLEDGTETLTEIFEEKQEKEILSFAERIEILSQEIDQINNLDTKRKISELEKLQKLLETQKLNSNQLPVSLYYPKVQELIDFKYISSMKIEDIEKLEAFFGVNPHKPKIYQKILKK